MIILIDDDYDFVNMIYICRIMYRHIALIMYILGSIDNQQGVEGGE